jgi:hypothetical protein
MNPPLSRADITRLEREPLTHVTPGRVNDHICIGMVKTLRWIADRAFRERYIHRATMLVTVAAAAPAAGSVAAYLRMFFNRRPTSTGGSSSALGRRTSVSAEVASPFLTGDRDYPHPHASLSASALGHGSNSNDGINGGSSRLHHSRPNSAVSGASLMHSYVDELRGLLAQSECHAVHYQILSTMAEITTLERTLVLLLQSCHFAIYLTLFLFYPRMGFRLMAYTAEESSVVWTQMVNDVDLGKIAELRVPKLALRYWGLTGVFTAQGALVPMVVPPKAQDVVPFCAEEKIEGATGAGRGSRGDAALTDKRKEEVKTEGGTAAAEPASSSSTLAGGDAGGAKPSDLPFHSAPAVEEGNGSADNDAEGGRQMADDAARRSPTVADLSGTVFTLRDVVLLIRSDEMVFRDLNHEMASELDTQPGFLRQLLDKYE